MRFTTEGTKVTEIIMSRSGYVNDCDDESHLAMWRGQVASAIRGRRGQAFLMELAVAMDSMPDKVLIREELIDSDGCCCTIGVVCKSRGVDVTQIDLEDTRRVGNAVGIAHQLAAEIEYMNDEWGPPDETPEQRWQRMRRWVDDNLRPENREVVSLSSP